MKNENMDVEDLYLAPEETNETNIVGISDTSAAETSETIDVAKAEMKRKKPKKIEEITSQRGPNFKVFRMNDGTEQAVFSPSTIHVFDDETHTFEDVDNTLIEDDDGRHFTCGKNNFVAKFSSEDNNDDIFSIEQGMHKVTVCARKNKKNRNKGVKPNLHKTNKEGIIATDLLTFADIETNTDYEYSVEGSGVKENIVIKKPSVGYRYPFVLKCENVTARFDGQAQRIAFISNETGEEAFFIPAPFMTDANGVTSACVSYEIKDMGNGIIHLNIIADCDFINSAERAFPVIIDPQIKLSGSSTMTTYSWENGNLFNSSQHIVGTLGNGDGYCNSKRMYIKFNMPTLPRNPRIKKAELVFSQVSAASPCNQYDEFGLYRVTEEICCGNCTPINDSTLIDFAKIKTSGDNITYTFDVTSLIDMRSKNEISEQTLVMKMVDESSACYNRTTLYGSSNSDTYSPKLIITYESSYGINTSYRTHTHELGRFGQGSIDLQCGNLMFESEDFAWSGNRMPVTVKHLFNSALVGYNYTNDSSIKLNTANFSSMKLGKGFKLNIMQSMMSVRSGDDSASYDEYVYIGENGEETYFKQSEKLDASQTYKLYEDVNGGDMIYDPEKRTLTQGEEIYLFDNNGRLIKITDAFGNHIDIDFTADQITTVTDGAGREFAFAYNSNGELISITAPDQTKISYAYTNSMLTGINYPDGKKAVIAYSSGKPSSISLQNASGATLYKVEYTFNGDRVSSVREYGSESSLGTQSSYSYSVAAARTVVTTLEQSDGDESESNEIKTVYAFDFDGNVISSYTYTDEKGNMLTEDTSEGIHPYSGDGGVGYIGRSRNFLDNHSFKDMTSWSLVGGCNGYCAHTISNENESKYGVNLLELKANASCCEYGVQQVTRTLKKGDYTFSAYIKIKSSFCGCENSGVFLRVTDTEGNTLCESEKLFDKDEEYTRLIASFTLSESQSVIVHILANGIGHAYVDAPQLEDNPFASPYNLLSEGDFENEGASWNLNNIGPIIPSFTDKFNMYRSLMIYGDVTQKKYALTANIDIKTKASTRETFTVSGWAKAYALPQHTDGENSPEFRLRAVIYYGQGSREKTEAYADFNPRTNEWQFVSFQIAKEIRNSIKFMRIYCDYSYNSGQAFFDDIQIVRDSIETGLTNEDFTFTDTSTEDDGDTVAIVSDGAPEFSEAKDKFGNALTETTFTDGEFGTIYRSFKFNEDDTDMPNNDAGNNLIEETDARGNKTYYTVNGDTSRNEEVTDRLGNKTAYEYDDSGRTTKVTSKDANGTELATVSYAYDVFDNMTEIARGDGLRYSLAYNEFHNLESIGINGKTENLIKYTYKNGNGRLKEMTYANGDTMKASYNSIGQMVAEKWYNSSNELIAHYGYLYDGEGNIVRSIDFIAKKEYNYEYDEGRIVRASEANIVLSGEVVTSKIIVNTVKYYYDTESKVTKKVITAADGTAQTIYYENNDDNAVIKFSVPAPTEEEPNKTRLVTAHSKTDSFGRKVFDEVQLGTGWVSRHFSYHEGVATAEHYKHEKVKSTATTQLVKQIVLSDGHTLCYEYDAEERITSVADKYTEGTLEIIDTTLYTYDALGQLLTETNKIQTTDRFGNEPVVNIVTNQVNEMTYDNYGNIRTKNGKQYCYDATWRDLLTCYDGQCIDYDAQGNPTYYLGHNLTWEKGRQLKSFDGNTYTYNANGIRTSKTINGIKHTYTLEGTKILREEWMDECYTAHSITPLYDNEESVCGIIYNGVPYYFIKNLQGDVIAIVDKEAKTVARYSYDAWGACTVEYDNIATLIANINPFRYRGYYYDEEIELYYLQSRYYDSSVGRFINCDEITTILLSQDVVINLDLFSYCQNLPVVLIDDLGLFSFDDIKKFFNKIISGLKKRIEDYFKSLIIIKKRYVSISTDVFSTAINIILGLILRSYVVKAFNTGLKIFKCTYLASHTGKAVEIMTKIVTFFLNNGFGKFLVKMMARRVVISAGLSVSLIGVVADGLLADFINSISKLASKVWTVVSAFSSIGNLLAFVFCDLPDGKIDGRLTIAW